ncbi:hypothetical protein BOTCAL_0122g00020 [Botryotinia calthae]|uniref:Uncharacterized protein n=1 Tax=Botryotinia calthae TaxID=38488 RepID=A0A4Y8D720_9HELO|nr:hypothetical protein BOTCAL_0122g00020 [Botryotinia calthae]
MSNSKKSLINFSAFIDKEEEGKKIQGWFLKVKGNALLSDITDCVAGINDIGDMVVLHGQSSVSHAMDAMP